MELNGNNRGLNMTIQRINSSVKAVLIALLIIAVSGVVNVYAAESLPRIQRIDREYVTIKEGDTQTLDIFANYSGKVQYRVWIANRKTNIWEDITNGYTEALDGKKVFTITTPKLKEGEYGISVWVKRAGAAPKDKRGFDNFGTAKMFCLKSDGQESNIKLDKIKNNYAVGESIEVKREEGKQYSYSYSVHDLINNKTLIPFTPYKDNLSWKTSKEGLYLLKVSIKSIERIEVPKPEENKGDEKSLADIKDPENDGQIVDGQALENNPEQAEVIDENKTVGKESINSDYKVIDETATANDNKLIENKEDDNKETEKVNENSTEEIQEEVEYKEIERETQIVKLLLVGDPFGYKGLTVPTAPTVKALVVANTGEAQRIYIKAQPSSSSKNVGSIYGSLAGVKILKTVGKFYYIEATDYDSLKLIKGYVYTSQLKTVKPSGSYSIVVDLSEQRVRIFKGNKLEKTFKCSTGQDWTPTPMGTYLIGDRGSQFYTGYKNSVVCYNWVRFNNDFLFHSTLHTRSGQEIVSEAKKLGTKASHGCIRLAVPDIKWIYNTIPRGTLVVVQQ